MESKAVARTIRIAPRKVRLVLDLIRGKEVAEAIAILKLTNKASSPVVEKLLMSALANAEHNYDMNIDTLIVKEAYANEGPTLKRFRPRAQGRASAINKRTSHITIVVGDKEVKTSNKAVTTEEAK
ncbi:50S ribosomal protein L22 [Macrococcoides goetzii]|nr:50S ribosomal protein L22 [Macrococcus goetzii]TDM40534.1 50S ribosomal protein L22 [Macrococcus goetzii]